MKILVRLLLMISIFLTLAQADDKILFPENLRAKWTELEELKFSDWGIKSFLGWDIPFDGGSKVFFFESDAGERFDLMVANPSYWTTQDKKLRRQVFIVIHKDRFYRIEPKSDEEKNMIKKLTKAAGKLSGEGKKDPKLLTSLAERLESREPIFNPKDAFQPAPESKSEGKENPKPESEGSDKDGEKDCKLHHQPLKSVSGYLPDPDLMVDPGYGVTEFKSQFGDRYPHIAPWYFSPEKREDWNVETTIEVCEECVKICSRDFAAYMKIDEKVRWDQYVEFLGKKGRRERDSVSPVGDGNGTDIDPDSSKPSEELHLPSDLPPLEN